RAARGARRTRPAAARRWRPPRSRRPAPQRLRRPRARTRRTRRTRRSRARSRRARSAARTWGAPPRSAAGDRLPLALGHDVRLVRREFREGLDETRRPLHHDWRALRRAEPEERPLVVRGVEALARGDLAQLRHAAGGRAHDGPDRVAIALRPDQAELQPVVGAAAVAVVDGAGVQVAQVEVGVAVVVEVADREPAPALDRVHAVEVPDLGELAGAGLLEQPLVLVALHRAAGRLEQELVHLAALPHEGGERPEAQLEVFFPLSRVAAVG